MSRNTENAYDICFIGAGLSCTYTLLHYVEQLEKFPQPNKVHLCIIDKATEFWTGIPYGNRSGFNSLIITSLKEFLPPAELEIFIEWFKMNFEIIVNHYTKTGGLLAVEWLKNNEHLITEGLWDKLYIPRYIFGQFLTERMTVLMNGARKKGLLDYELLAAEVTNVHKNSNDSFQIWLVEKSGKKKIIQSKKVILSIGSPRKKELHISDKNSLDFICIQDMYEPAFKENNSRMFNFLKNRNKSSKKNILIIGSNASSLEVIYNLKSLEQLENLINKLYVLSPNGIFPHRINENKISVTYNPVNLKSLRNFTSNTCEQILEAVKKDVEKAQIENIAIADIYDSVSHVVIELLNKLNLHEQKQFVCTYGVEIGKLQRRAGAEYLNVVDRLIATNKLEFIKGKFIQQLQKHKQFTFEYFDFSDGEKKIFPHAIDVVINCIGAEDLNDSFSELIQNLIKQKICTVNGSQKGFDVNENFESSKNFFVIGPLLSGTLNKNLRIWHAESCPRIFYLSQQLAQYLIKPDITTVEI